MSETPFEVMASGFEFCEAPRVDARGDAYFSDLTGGGYHVARAGGTVETVLPERLWIGGAVFDQSGALIVSGKGGIIAVDPATGATRPILSEIAGTPIVAVNDIEADAAGGLYGGTIDFAALFERGEQPSGGILFRLDPSGEVSILREDVVASNGIGFSPDGGTMYHSESTVGIWAWRIERGLPVGPPELLVKLDDCDGLAVDEEGAFWIAFWSRGELRRYLPNGDFDRTATLPGIPHLVSPTFGADRDWLYVSTGANEAHPQAGGLVRLRVDVPGLPTFKARISALPATRELATHGS